MNIRYIIDKCTENWPRKLISFAMALLIFALYRVSLYKTVTISVPIQVIQDKSMCVSGRQDFACRVSIRSTPENIAAITEKNILATADISWQAKSGVYDVPITATLVNETQDLEPVELKVWPEHIQVKIEKTALAYIPLKPLFSGNVAKGYELASFSVKPDTILVSGPESVVNALDFIDTEKVDLKNQASPFSKRVGLLNINGHIKIEEQKTATVIVDIVPKIATRQFVQRTVALEKLSDKFSLSSVLPKIDFELKGPTLLLEKIKPEDNIATVDCSTVTKAGDYNLKVLINTPKELSLNSINQDTVSLTFIDSQKESLSTNTTSEQNKTQEASEE